MLASHSIALALGGFKNGGGGREVLRRKQKDLVACKEVRIY